MLLPRLISFVVFILICILSIFGYAQVNFCNDELIKTIDFGITSSPSYSASCDICESRFYSCSLTSHREPSPVTFSTILPEAFSSTKWIAASWSMRYVAHFLYSDRSNLGDNNDDVTSTFSLYPLLLNGTRINPSTDNNFTIELFAKYKEERFCNSCYQLNSGYQNPDSMEQMAQLLQNSKRIDASVIPISHDLNLCITESRLFVCQVPDKYYGSRISIDAEIFPSISNSTNSEWIIDTSDLIYIETNSSNSGPDPVPNPQINITVPNVIRISNIIASIFSKTSDEEIPITVNIIDNRNMDEAISDKSFETRLDTFAAKETPYNMSCLLSSTNWNESMIHCEYVNNNGVNDSEPEMLMAGSILNLQVIADKIISPGGAGKLSVSFGSKNEDWVSVLKPKNLHFNNDVEFIRQDRFITDMNLNFKALKPNETNEFSEPSTFKYQIPSNQNETILRGKFFNQGPEEFPSPTISISFPAITVLKGIKIYQADVNNTNNIDPHHDVINEYSLSISDQRIRPLCSGFYPPSYPNVDSPFCGLIQNENTLDSSNMRCVVMDQNPPDFQTWFPQWNITCTSNSNVTISKQASLIVDITSSEFLESGAAGPVSLKIWNPLFYWVNSNFQPISSMNVASFLESIPSQELEIPIMNRDVKASCSLTHSSKFIIRNSTQTSSFTPIEPTTKGRDILIIFINLENQNYGYELSAQFRSSYPSSQSVFTLSQFYPNEWKYKQLSIDLELFNSVKLNNGNSAMIYLNHSTRNDNSVVPFRISSFLSGTFDLSKNSRVAASFMISLSYIELQIPLREKKRDQRMLEIRFSNLVNVREASIVLRQENEFSTELLPQYEMNDQTVYQIDIDDEKAESSGEDRIRFIGGIDMLDCDAWKCELDVGVDISSYRPPQRQILKLESSESENVVPVTLNESDSSLIGEFELDVWSDFFSDSNYETDDRLPYTLFILGSDTSPQRDNAREEKPGISPNLPQQNEAVQKLQTNVSLSLRQPINGGGIIEQVGLSVLNLPQASISVEPETMYRLMQTVRNTAGSINETILVLSVERTFATGRIPSDKSASIYLKAETSTPVVLEEYSEKMILEPYIETPLDWESYKITFPSYHNTILNMNTSSASEYDRTTVCFALNKISLRNSTSSLCQSISTSPMQIFVNQDSAYVFPSPQNGTPTLDNNQGYSVLTAPYASVSRLESLVVTFFFDSTSTSRPIEEFYQSLEILFKPPLIIRPEDDTRPILYDRERNQSQLLAFDVRDQDALFCQLLEDARDEACFSVEMRHFIQNDTADYEYELFRRKRCFITLDNDTLENNVCEYVSTDKDNSNVVVKIDLHLASDNIDLNQVSTIYLWFSVVLSSDINDSTTLYTASSNSSVYKVSSVPIQFPEIPLIVVPTVLYTTFLFLGILVAFLGVSICHRCLDNEDCDFEPLDFQGGICVLTALTIVLILIAIVCAGCSAIHDCSSKSECCRFGSYYEEAQDHFDDFHRFYDQPVLQSSIGNRSNNVESATADCVFGLDVYDLDAYCVDGVTYETCRRGTGELVIAAMGIHSVSFLTIGFIICCCLSYRKFKRDQK